MDYREVTLSSRRRIKKNKKKKDIDIEREHHKREVREDNLSGISTVKWGGLTTNIVPRLNSRGRDTKE